MVKRSLQLLVATSAEDAMSDNISELSILEKSKLLNFQAVMFQRIEKDFIRTEYLPLVPFSIDFFVICLNLVIGKLGWFRCCVGFL